MAVDSRDDDVRAAWLSQPIENQRPSVEEMRRAHERMEKRMRFGWIYLVTCSVLGSVVITIIAALFPHPMLTIGAVALVAGFAVVVTEVAHHRGRAPVAEDGAAVSLDYHRAFLRHLLAFHRTRLWLRVVAITPGGLLFFLGFAAARPDLAWIIYLELATFVVAVMLMVPLNRRAAAKLENELAQLERTR